MARPTTGLYVYGGNEFYCEKCGREPSLILLFNRDKNVYCGHEVECYDCGLHSGRCDTEEEAIKKWNELTKGVNYGND